MEDLMNKMRNNLDIDTIYGLRFDSSFKNVYQDEEQLKNMIYLLFHEEIPKVENFRNRELGKENVNLKCGICDLIVDTKENILLVEVQNKNLKDFNKRLKRYISLLYVTQKLGRDYRQMKPVKVYLILNYRERKKTKQILKIYTEMEKELKEQFDFLSEIRVWNIKEALKEKIGIDYHYARLYLLDTFPKEEALKILEELYQDEGWKAIVEKIMIYNLDIETYQKLKEEKYMFETSFELETSGLRVEAERKALRKGKKLGKAIGISEGKLETASQLMKAGVPLDLIIQATGLEKERILNY